MQNEYPQEVIIFLVVANLIVVGFLVFYALIVRLQQKRKFTHEKDLLEKEMMTRQDSYLQISRDLHDEIGSSLSGIAMLTQLVIVKIQEKRSDESLEVLQRINSYNQDLIEKVSDISWLMKPNMESLSLLLEKIKKFAVATTATKMIEFHYSEEIPETGRNFNINERKAVYLISKEAINNSVKYANCKNIYYSFVSKANRAILEISDDGKGFISRESSTGNGLKNIKARAEAIKAELILDSSEAGTTIRLIL